MNIIKRYVFLSSFLFNSPVCVEVPIFLRTDNYTTAIFETKYPKSVTDNVTNIWFEYYFTTPSGVLSGLITSTIGFIHPNNSRNTIPADSNQYYRYALTGQQ